MLLRDTKQIGTLKEQIVDIYVRYDVLALFGVDGFYFLIGSEDMKSFIREEEAAKLEFKRIAHEDIAYKEKRLTLGSAERLPLRQRKIALKKKLAGRHFDANDVTNWYNYEKGAKKYAAIQKEKILDIVRALPKDE